MIKMNRILTIAALAALLLGLVALSGCGRGEQPEAEAVSKPVKTLRVQPGAGSRFLFMGEDFFFAFSTSLLSLSSLFFLSKAFLAAFSES